MSLASRSEHQLDSSQWEAAVSSWVDGEETVRAEELDTPYGRQLWDTYHLIGDVLRSEDLAMQPSDLFYARVSRAIDAEPTIMAPGKLHPSSRWRRGLSGAALAAVVSSMAWLVVLYLPDDTSPPSVAPATQQLAALPETDMAEDLHEYMDAHGNLTGTIPVKLVSYVGAQR